MNLSKTATTAVIVIASISLLGLSWAQFNWLKDSIETNRQIFYQKIDLAAELAGEESRRDESLLKHIDSELYNYQALNQNTQSRITGIIDTALSTYNISTGYKYAFYEHANDKAGIFQWTGGNFVDSAMLNFSCSSGERSFGWTNLTCNTTCANSSDYRGDYHLAVFFPDADLYLLSQSKDSLLSSLLFIGILMACFAYTIITIRRQKKLSEMKNDFINNLTHEFKTPIFSIDLASGILKKSPELQQSDKLLKYVDVIDSEGKRLKNQVDKVLQMALIDSGNFKLEKKKMDIHELIIKVVKNFEILIADRSGKIELNLLANKTTLFADETHMKNILYNLLDNAMKYSEKNPEIIITTHDEKGGLSLSIQDNGIGINEHVQKYIFDKFYRCDTSNIHNIKGFGLGLSYVKSVIDAHNAKIDLISKPAMGTKFILQFSL